MSVLRELPGPTRLQPRVAELVEAVDGLVAQDPRQLHPDELGGVLKAVQTLIDRLAGYRARCLNAFDQRRPRSDGSAPTAQWVRGALRQSAGDADRQVHTARQLEERPAVQAAFDAGRIGQRAADILADTLADPHVRDLPWAESTLLEWAQSWDPGIVARKARQLRVAAHQERAAAEEAAARRRRYVRFDDPDRDGMVGLRGLLDPVSSEVLKTAISALMRPDPTDLPAGQRRTADQRRHDALVTLAELALDHDRLPAVAKRRPHVLLVLPHPDLRGGLQVEDRAEAMVAELAHTGAVSDATAARLGCDADWTPVFVDPQGVPLDLGRTQRSASAQQMDALVVRDRRCRRCGAPSSNCQAHHIRWWRSGGATDLANLVLLCWGCHSLVHDHGWQVRLLPDATAVFTAPDGTVHRRGPAP